MGRADDLLDDAVGHCSSDVSQAHFAAGVAVGKLLVVQAEQVQDRRVPVVDVHSACDRFVAVVVGRSVAQAAFHSASGHPHGVALVVVVAARAAV